MSDLPERIATKIDKNGPVPDYAPHLGPCWIWTAGTDGRGYGSVWDTRRRAMRKAHRVVYEILVGPVPSGLELDHLCRVRLCVNLAHLEPVTHIVNAQRGEAGKHLKDLTHCPKGHPYDEENTYVLPSRPTARYCRACNRERNAASCARWRAKRRTLVERLGREGLVI